ncbi:U3 small nucleolar RNA-associated protein 5 [Candida viswanathii]|uniref:U3 small nucleolar RNA-associated protein 5 n=1 Tax=Candida viswanathii TaxID=5486 RepID=A0A367YJI1_9ASCO|nr:U3 small nucleolar RNA-associated protein 5 [Candida viswanathii]
MSGSVICSKFDPSGSYLATALVALDSHQIKVQSTANQSSTSSLNTSFTLDKSNKLTNLSWIPSTSTSSLLALCLTRGTILVYSPQTNEIVSELSTGSNVAILDFHYSEITQSGWSCDIEGTVTEWDLGTFETKLVIKVRDVVDSIDEIHRVTTVVYDRMPCLLLGSNAVYLFNIRTREVVRTFPGHIQPINAIVPVGDGSFLTSAKGDRFVNLYLVDKTTTKAVFVASSSVVSLAVGVQDDKSVLVVINEEGQLEVFNNALSEQPKSAPSTPVAKKKRKQVGVSSRSSNGSIKLSRPEQQIKNPQDASLVINSVITLGDSILFTWLENASIPFFDSLKWIDETGNFLLDTSKTISKSKPDLRVTQHTTINGHDVAAPKLYTEGHTIISDGSNIRHLEEDESDVNDESLAEKLDRLSVDSAKTPVKSRRKKLEEARSGVSLSIILTQSLQSNDTSLLETVLQNRDVVTIQNTISRLDPHTAVIFLDKLSDKLQRQPTRFETFLFWLKWILVIHGPVIASMPNLNVKLAALYSVLNKKAENLPRLLELQGREKLSGDSAALKSEIYDEELVGEKDEDELDEPSDVEYVEELDDAQYIGVISEDEDELMDGVDDYEESEDEDVEEDDDDDEDVDIPSAADLESEEEEEEENE